MRSEAAVCMPCLSSRLGLVSGCFRVLCSDVRGGLSRGMLRNLGKKRSFSGVFLWRKPSEPDTDSEILLGPRIGCV